MIKALEQAIQKVRALPEDKQRLAAELLEELAAEPSSFLIPAGTGKLLSRGSTRMR